MLRAAECAGRGRALVAATNLEAGRVVLRESPLLVYAEAEAATSGCFCHRCCKWISATSSYACPGCRARFCTNPQCLSSHLPWLCSALARLADLGLGHEAETRARFLLAAIELWLKDSAGFQRLLQLEGGEQMPEEGYTKVAFAVESILRGSQTACLPSELMVKLLDKDKRNAFGLMAPSSQDGQRRVRAYAIYAQASLFNHDCLPNACRFEYLDVEGPNNTDIHIRLLHDVNEGAEVCLSYFPVNWSRDERQKRLLEDYSFQCSCDRCNVEAAWGQDMEEDEDNSPEADEVDDVRDEADDDRDEADDDFPHAMFFVKYLCPVQDCGGTMAPLPDEPSTMECNACGQLRTEEAFLRELGSCETE